MLKLSPNYLLSLHSFHIDIFLPGFISYWYILLHYSLALLMHALIRECLVVLLSPDG
jgi:hypothetical protein